MTDKVQQRFNFGHELKKEIQMYGELQEKGGSLKGDLHRTWMNLTTTFTSDDTERILEEVERGEKASLEVYNDILNDTEMTLAPSTEYLLKRQRDEIKKAFKNVGIYEDTVS